MDKRDIFSKKPSPEQQTIIVYEAAAENVKAKSSNTENGSIDLWILHIIPCGSSINIK